jgi:hypothetical protein
MTIHSYSDAADYLGKKANRPLPGRATRLIRNSDTDIAVHYQNTDVVTYHANGIITLNSDGWQTMTTKARFSEYSRARVFADKSIWYIGGDWSTPKEKRMLYYDGIVINLDGLPLEPKYPTLSDMQVKHSLDKAISAYIKGYTAYVDAGELTPPGNGDCFGCLFQVKDAPTVTQGEFRLNRPTPHGRVEPLGVDHYIQHFEEKYFVPSLLWNAITAKGYRDAGLIWHMIAERKDGKWAGVILRGYFKNLKPALLAVTHASM